MNTNTYTGTHQTVIRNYLQAINVMNAWAPNTPAWIKANTERLMWAEAWQNAESTTVSIDTAARDYLAR
jgi:hypothetical protein